jgi:carbamoyltransferase
LTGCPILINTSFNVRGEPIVCTPEDAFYCFMGTGLDMLVIGNLVLTKDQQNKALFSEYKNKFGPD